MFNKRAQIGETMTWVVATIIIIFLLVVSIFISGGSDRAKKIVGLDKIIDFPPGIDESLDKSLFSYLLTEEIQGKIFEKIKEEGNLNPLNGNFAVKILKEMSKADYPRDIWFGVGFKSNDYFSQYTIPRYTKFFIREVNLNETSKINLIVINN